MTRYRKWRNAGKCGGCGKEPREGKSSCLRCYKAQKKWQKENYVHKPLLKPSLEELAARKEKWRLYSKAYKKTDKYRVGENARKRRKYHADPIYREKILMRNKNDLFRESRKGKRLKSQYGITEEEYTNLLFSQHGGCAICGRKTADDSGRKLAVDHCHKTGKVRGLLCSNHNFGLGLFQDNPLLLLKAAEYLKGYQDQV